MSFRMPYSLMNQLNEQAKHSGLSKTEIVVRAIASYLDSQKNNSLEQRIEKIEAKIINMEKQRTTI